ncbi:hypothetical protein D3C80_2225440 [compost metagenome]
MHVVENIEVALAIVTDTGVHHDSAIRCFDDKALPGNEHLAISVKEVRLEPVEVRSD